MDYVLRTFELAKQFKNKKAVESVSISVRRGEIYGFLGQDGAGKTTTIRMLLGHIKPQSGVIELFGRKIKRWSGDIYERVGSVEEYPGFYPNLTAFENLEIHRKLLGTANKEYTDEALELTGLISSGNMHVKGFSQDMRRRLGLARALLHKPELLILDEPAAGLDPIGIMETRQLIQRLVQQRKMTVFMSSHILSDVQQLASRIGIIHKGRLIEEVDREELNRRNRKYIEIHVSDTRRAAVILEQKLGITDYTSPQQCVIRIYEMLDDVQSINSVLVKNDIGVGRIGLGCDSLEEYFAKLTGGAHYV